MGVTSSDAFGRDPGEPLVVSVLAPLPPDPSLQALLAHHVDQVEVHFTPYNETREARADRGANHGVLAAGAQTPAVSDATRAIWKRSHVFVSLDLPSDPTLAPKLQWMQTISAGVDHIDLNQLAAMGARLTSARGIASTSIAEFVMARLLHVWKHLGDLDINQQNQVWEEKFGTEVAGRTLLMVGLGSIGREIARRARAFDMVVLATRNSAAPGDTDPDVDELHPGTALVSLLPQADAVVCALPSSAATTDLFDAAMFDRMKPDAIFCNVGRGTLVVEPDLVATLERGHLRAAVLDVMRTEPLPANDPLWTAPRAHLSPHVAVSLDRYQQNAWALLADNLSRFVSDQPLRNEIDTQS